MSEYMYKVVENFVSINGEGRRAGELAVFIRFQRCNLNCSYCDTLWANGKDASYEVMTDNDIISYLDAMKVTNVTLTGGEPLLRENMGHLIEMIMDKGYRVEIETNGSIALMPYTKLKYRPSFTMDYKLPSSGMEKAMNLDNFNVIDKNDTVKFVAGSMEDLNRTKEIVDRYDLLKRTKVYISPVFGEIEPEEIVNFMIRENLNEARLQVQIHKVIWDPDKRGV